MSCTSVERETDVGVPRRRRNGQAQAEGEEMSLPNHRERQFMQNLRSGAWVKANAASAAGPKLIESMIGKGWIERRGLGNELAYRITDKGLEAKKMPVRL